MKKNNQSEEKNNQSEAWHQEQIFRWARANQIKIPELQLLNASLNGVKLSKFLAGKMKRQGMRKGYPDIFLPIPKNSYHGLFIELKKENGGTILREQKVWLKKLNELGYLTIVVYGYIEAIKTIKQYLVAKLDDAS